MPSAIAPTRWSSTRSRAPWRQRHPPRGRDTGCASSTRRSSPQADIPRFARLGVIPSMQPTHCTSDMRWAEARLGPERLAGAYAWRSLLATGSPIAGGSDFPVEDANPFHGIYAAVTRRPLWGERPALAARAVHDARGGRARVHDVERLRGSARARAWLAGAGQARRPGRPLRRRLHVRGGAHQGHRPRTDDGGRRGGLSREASVL